MIDGRAEPDVRQIPEDQLLEYLKNHFEIVHKLSNGDVIVKR